jgi:hypothetical protein
MYIQAINLLQDLCTLSVGPVVLPNQYCKGKRVLLSIYGNIRKNKKKYHKNGTFKKFNRKIV